ncbi:CinA family nicotinamide mononucleotide deamidase-related protein [Desulfuromonas sp. KJ2020]|uniref:CinA family nicotinamide mononucleotide deamidase-related protein n=1 Tax=Desulfuromonas sp. KJ2020 TaxID=2919173 RepID=UPI0020A7EC8D|nr:CinA family nicotinamide mononucleotide deamidase-related protein [Desulfuromonas sp. KJ2020]MCP3176762.1 CinA family nicotinamide mononucleotide deamidase-related protein [Desulfuromonas sp. KJ2020]
MDIAVLTIGDELLSGELADTNTRRIARLLSPHGYGLREALCVGDQKGDIEEALVALTARRDVVIVTGGLGPTADDLTAAAAAHAFGLPLETSDEALRLIRQHFTRLGVDMHPRNDKQALLPQGAALMPNPKGTAPGFSLKYQNATLFFLPGVPAEMASMLEESVLPALWQRQGGQPPRQERLLKVFGLSEPRVEELLSRQTLPDSVQLAFGVDFPLVIVKLRCARPEAAELLDRGEAQARQALGDFVIATGSQTLAENVARRLIDSGSTLAVAESCTGGLIATWLTDRPGASAFLERGAVTYANSAKQDWLQVPEQILVEQGAVSEACALAMATGIRRAAGTRLGIAVTGIAGPDGGTAQKPVGTVFIALSAADEERAKGYRFRGDRHQIRTLAACMALDWIRRYLLIRHPL